VKRIGKLRDMKERQSESGFARRENKEGKLRRLSVSMRSVLRIGNIEKERKRNSVNMTGREIKKGSANGRRRLFMMKKTKRRTPEKGGIGVPWRRRGRRGYERRRMTWLTEERKRRKLLRPRSWLRRKRSINCSNREKR